MSEGMEKTNMIPVVSKAKEGELMEKVPNWKELTDSELRERIRLIVRESDSEEEICKLLMERLNFPAENITDIDIMRPETTEAYNEIQLRESLDASLQLKNGSEVFMGVENSKGKFVIIG